MLILGQTNSESVNNSQRNRAVNPEDVESLVFDWGTFKWLSDPRTTNAERFSFGVGLLAPGKGHTRHNHPGVEEVLYFISGEGEQMVDDKRYKVKPGMLFHIPPSVYHETINTGWENLKVIAIYSSPGPEKSLRELSEKILPPGEIPRK